jgi:hypothetical protein
MFLMVIISNRCDYSSRTPKKIYVATPVHRLTYMAWVDFLNSRDYGQGKSTETLKNMSLCRCVLPTGSHFLAVSFITSRKSNYAQL